MGPRCRVAPMLELDDVSFAYADGRPVLDGCPCRCPRARASPGRALRRREVDPARPGRGLLPAGRRSRPLGRTDVREMPRAALRARIGYVEQEVPVLAGTVRDRPVAHPARRRRPELWAVLADVGLTDVVRWPPRGLDVLVGDEGVSSCRAGASAPGHRPLVAAGPAGAAPARRARPRPSDARRVTLSAIPWRGSAPALRPLVAERLVQWRPTAIRSSCLLDAGRAGRPRHARGVVDILSALSASWLLPGAIVL